MQLTPSPIGQYNALDAYVPFHMTTPGQQCCGMTFKSMETEYLLTETLSTKRHEMWYDTVMMPRCKRVLLFGLLIFWSLTLPAISLYPTLQLDDPMASEKVLSDKEFIRELNEQEKSAANQLEISLTTMGRGDPLYIWFGHSGLVVTDRNSERSVMYDYGIFSFDDDFYQTFALGRLNYEVWATSAPARHALAIEEDRTTSSITLNLPASATLELVNFLNFNIQPENNTYLYHHYNENCSTRIRDLIDKTVGGQFKEWATSIPYEESIRQMVMRHTAASPGIDWTLNFLQSGVIDKPITLWEAMFLPAVLEQALLDFSYTDGSGTVVPIVSGERKIIHEATPGIRPLVMQSYRSMTPYGLLFGFFVGILSLVFGRVMTSSKYTWVQSMGRISEGWLNFIWTFATGILGTLLLFMMIASNHDVTYFNENILFANPWLLVMSIQALASAFGKEKAIQRFRKGNTVLALLIAVSIILKGVFFDLLIQQNWQIMLTLLPIYIANSSIPFERLFRKRHKFLDDDDL
jgi:hypothetical protein